eukprot:PRCOL_00003579-RA
MDATRGSSNSNNNSSSGSKNNNNREGGGQVLRVSAALAAITRTPLVVTGVRAKRSRPGLRPQHLEGLRLIARACGAALAGGEVGSTALALLPGDAQAAVDRRRELVADTGTAGSVTMLAQAVLPVLLYADAPAREGESEGEGIELRARLVGGTDAAMAPPVDYMRRVLLPTLQDRFGVRARAELRRRGFYPRGGGTLVLHVAPLARGAAMPPLRTRGAGAPPAPMGFEVFAFDAGAASGKGFADTAHAAATTELEKLVGEDYCVDGHVDAADAASDGVLGGGGGVSVVMRIAGAGHESFGAAGAAEVIDLKSGDPKAAGEQAARRAAAVVRSLGGKGAFADADEHLQDQLVIFMALAEGKSELLCVGEGADGDERGGQLTLHMRTAMDVCKQMLPTCSFEVEALDGGGWKVVCTGAGVRKA